MNFYTLSQIARMATLASPATCYSEDMVYRQWVVKEGLAAEVIPPSIRGGGRYNRWVKESDLIEFLCSKGFPVEKMFNHL